MPDNIYVHGLMLTFLSCYRWSTTQLRPVLASLMILSCYLASVVWSDPAAYQSLWRWSSVTRQKRQHYAKYIVYLSGTEDYDCVINYNNRGSFLERIIHLFTVLNSKLLRLSLIWFNFGCLGKTTLKHYITSWVDILEMKQHSIRAATINPSETSA